MLRHSVGTGRPGAAELAALMRSSCFCGSSSAIVVVVVEAAVVIATAACAAAAAEDVTLLLPACRLIARPREENLSPVLNRLSEKYDYAQMGGGGRPCVVACRRFLRCDVLLLSPTGRRCCLGCVSGENHTLRCSDNSRRAERRPPTNKAGEYSMPSRGLRFCVGQTARSSSNSSSGRSCMHRVPVLVYDVIWHTYFFMRPYHTALQSTTTTFFATRN